MDNRETLRPKVSGEAVSWITNQWDHPFCNVNGDVALRVGSTLLVLSPTSAQYLAETLLRVVAEPYEPPRTEAKP